MDRHEEALASYEKALAIRPDHAEALNSCGNALAALRRYAQALASYDQALALRPDYAEALCGRADVLAAAYTTMWDILQRGGEPENSTSRRGRRRISDAEAPISVFR
jgi:tetratricopeptide (TPR) repeat protein